MKAHQVARLTGVSVRTLHHYDQIGLLCPGRNQENGYREYTHGDLATLQQILFFRECGFSLEKIGELLKSPAFDREAAFRLQRKALLHQRQRIDAMLHTLDASLKELKGEAVMTPEQKFEGFHFGENPYQEEARRLWGHETVDRSEHHIASLGEEGREQLAQSFHHRFQGLAELVDSDPRGPEAQAAMAGLYRYFNSSFGIRYSPQAFAGLGRMYVEDERFTQSIDQYAQGLSAFLAEAMAAYGDAMEE